MPLHPRSSEGAGEKSHHPGSSSRKYTRSSGAKLVAELGAKSGARFGKVTRKAWHEAGREVGARSLGALSALLQPCKAKPCFQCFQVRAQTSRRTSRHHFWSSRVASHLVVATRFAATLRAQLRAQFAHKFAPNSRTCRAQAQKPKMRLLVVCHCCPRTHSRL